MPNEPEVLRRWVGSGAARDLRRIERHVLAVCQEGASTAHNLRQQAARLLNVVVVLFTVFAVFPAGGPPRPCLNAIAYVGGYLKGAE